MCGVEMDWGGGVGWHLPSAGTVREVGIIDAKIASLPEYSVMAGRVRVVCQLLALEERGSISRAQELKYLRMIAEWISGRKGIAIGRVWFRRKRGLLCWLCDHAPEVLTMPLDELKGWWEGICLSKGAGNVGEKIVVSSMSGCCGWPCPAGWEGYAIPPLRGVG
jgi:hypothetical protein